MTDFGDYGEGRWEIHGVGELGKEIRKEMKSAVLFSIVDCTMAVILEMMQYNQGNLLRAEYLLLWILKDELFQEQCIPLL